MAVDDCPIASGLITQDVLANLSIGSHLETKALAVVTVGYPIILGLDWLSHYNPSIDWAESHLTLSCCGSSSHPTKVWAKGFGPSPQPNSSMLRSLSAVGLGFGLSSPLMAPSLSASTTYASPITQEPEPPHP
ncbi:hypothetical protein DXG03_006273 [Asterophora parasitica]|uniref:Uncharacterized protein n=1 Tax=Asterophora parasitica TaxID=117018 RepID=A0A9P7FLY6_9AGAR|nr:hypothetical protein DXG03_006273 [Asterophora parasitica]